MLMKRYACCTRCGHLISPELQAYLGRSQCNVSATVLVTHVFAVLVGIFQAILSFLSVLLDMQCLYGEANDKQPPASTLSTEVSFKSLLCVCFTDVAALDFYIPIAVPARESVIADNFWHHQLGEMHFLVASGMVDVLNLIHVGHAGLTDEGWQ